MFESFRNNIIYIYIIGGYSSIGRTTICGVVSPCSNQGFLPKIINIKFNVYYLLYNKPR